MFHGDDPLETVSHDLQLPASPPITTNDLKVDVSHDAMLTPQPTQAPCGLAAQCPAEPDPQTVGTVGEDSLKFR